MPNMPTFARDEQAKLIKIFNPIDDLIAHHKKIEAKLAEIKRAIVIDRYKKLMPENQKSITFDRNSLMRLKRLYKKALDEGKTKDDIIVFEGHDLVVGYAKYLIEYLEGVLKN